MIKYLKLKYVIIPILFDKEQALNLISKELTDGKKLIEAVEQTEEDNNFNNQLFEAVEIINKENNIQMEIDYNYSGEIVIIEAIKEH